MVTILVPSNNFEKLENFYMNALGFSLDSDGLIFPDKSQGVRLYFMDEERGEGQNKGIYFRYRVHRDFLSYCQKLIDCGVEFQIIASHPGGYTARGFDLEKNLFEIECESFEESVGSINPFGWPMFKRY